MTGSLTAAGRVLSEIQWVLATSGERAAVRMMFSRVLLLFDAGDDEAVDHLLAWFSADDVAMEIAMALLAITTTARDRLPARARLLASVRVRLVAQRGEFGAARLLAGL